MFTHLHVHTEFSMLDGLSRIEQLTARAERLGMTSLAITDHGGMYGAVDFYNKARAHGLKAHHRLRNVRRPGQPPRQEPQRQKPLPSYGAVAERPGLPEPHQAGHQVPRGRLLLPPPHRQRVARETPRGADSPLRLPQQRGVRPAVGTQARRGGRGGGLVQRPARRTLLPGAYAARRRPGAGHHQQGPHRAERPHRRSARRHQRLPLRGARRSPPSRHRYLHPHQHQRTRFQAAENGRAVLLPQEPRRDGRTLPGRAGGHHQHRARGRDVRPQARLLATAAAAVPHARRHDGGRLPRAAVRRGAAPPRRQHHPRGKKSGCATNWTSSAIPSSPTTSWWCGT